MSRTPLRMLLVALCACAFGCGDRDESPKIEVTVPAAESAKPEAKSAEPAPAPPPAATAVIGQPAPDFTLTDTAGQSHTLASLRGKTVVLEWFNPDCPFVRYAHGEGVLKELAQQVGSADLVWLSINSGAVGTQGHGQERNQKALADYGMKNPILLDESGAVGRAYGAAKTPHLFVVDPKGVLTYRGGVDNAPMGTVDTQRPLPVGTAPGAHVVYLREALEDLRAGKPLRLADTPPYGCSVKYSS